MQRRIIGAELTKHMRTSPVESMPEFGLLLRLSIYAIEVGLECYNIKYNVFAIYRYVAMLGLPIEIKYELFKKLFLLH